MNTNQVLIKHTVMMGESDRGVRIRGIKPHFSTVRVKLYGFTRLFRLEDLKRAA